MQKKFETKYGYFTDNGTEYIITNYRTPRPWINVISNGSYGLIVSQLNGGFSWIDHANLNRLTRWQQDLVCDNWGKHLYLRDDENGEFWSPTFLPAGKELEIYQCRHGIGYTRFHSVYKGVEAKIRIFVPFNDNLEIWTVTLKNIGKQKRQISIFTYLEWCLGAGPDHHREFHKSFLETEFNQDHQALLARKRLWEIPSERGHWNIDWQYIAYFACSDSIYGYEGDKESFMGNYQNLSNPLALETGQLSQKIGKWNDSIASFKKVLLLHPDEEKTIHFYLGAEKNVERIFSCLTQFREPKNIDKAFKEMQKTWDRYLTATTIRTPDEAMNLMTNTWLKYQCIAGRLWGRAAYYQQSGAYGFRDQLQDSQIFLSIDPEQTKKQILLHAQHQFKSGKALHWWHPITDQGHDGNMSDDLLWLPFVTINYLKETADWLFLDEQTPFYDDPESNSIIEHCIRAIDCVLGRFSDRGLPLILNGDWNDGLSGVGRNGKGESIWLAHFLYYILNEMTFILAKRKSDEKVDQYRHRAFQLKNAINEFGWDGKWFWRASNDSGQLIGSHQNQEGKIFLNAQTWAIIAGTTDEKRQKQLLYAVEKMLDSDVGPLLLYPAYTTPDSHIGYLSRYAPGVRENGGVYMHAATWLIWALCIRKYHSNAYEMYRKISPIYNGLNPDRYCAEPYVTPGNIDGPASPHFGRGGWTWYTGSAAWLFRVTLDHLLGIRADYDGLIVDPCLPPEWNEVQIKRLFRGTNYFIKIINHGTRLKEIIVEGKKVSGNLIAPISNTKEVKVNVILS